jgi:amino acid transporter
MQAAAGPITPLVFVAALMLTLPTAISYAELNRDYPSTAAAAAWVWVGISPTAGFQAGLLMTTYFCMAAIAQPLMFALFFRDLLEQFNLLLPQVITLPAGVLIATIPVAWVCLRGAETSIKSTICLMILETLVVIALSITILVVKGGEPHGINFSAIDPHHGTGASGFWLAMILGVLAFCGFDVVSTAAEEAEAPRKHLPKAILLTVTAIALFWAVNAWVFTLSTPPERVIQYTHEGLTAVTPIARAYWGWGDLMVILTAFTGLTAVYISSVQGSSRIIFALARQGLLPGHLARLHGEQRVPRSAVGFTLLGVIALDFVSLYFLENGLDSFTWWANALVFFASLTFVSVNIANIFYFARHARGQLRLFHNLLIPIVGVALNLYLIYAAFLSALWADDWRTGKSVVVVCFALLLIQVAAALYVRLFKLHLLKKPIFVGAEAA